jgi:hypothetical protein
MTCHVLRVDGCTTGSQAMVPSCCIPAPSFSTIVRILWRCAPAGLSSCTPAGLVMAAIFGQERQVGLYRLISAGITRHSRRLQAPGQPAPQGGLSERMDCITLQCAKRRLHISRRPSMALEMVTSSANSKSLPTGIPIPMRVTFTPRGFRRRARYTAVASPSTVGLVATITS